MQRKAIVCVHGKTAIKEGRMTRRKMGVVTADEDCWGKEMRYRTRPKDSRNTNKTRREARLWEVEVR